MKEKFTSRPCEYFHEFLNDKWMQNVCRMFYKRISFHLVCELKVNACASWTFDENYDHKKCIGMDARL